MQVLKQQLDQSGDDKLKVFCNKEVVESEQIGRRTLVGEWRHRSPNLQVALCVDVTPALEIKTFSTVNA